MLQYCRHTVVHTIHRRSSKTVEGRTDLVPVLCVMKRWRGTVRYAGINEIPLGVQYYDWKRSAPPACFRWPGPSPHIVQAVDNVGVPYCKKEGMPNSGRSTKRWSRTIHSIGCQEVPRSLEVVFVPTDIVLSIRCSCSGSSIERKRPWNFHRNRVSLNLKMSLFLQLYVQKYSMCWMCLPPLYPVS